MSNDHIELETILSEQYIPNWNKLEKAKSENPFGEASFELLRRDAYTFEVSRRDVNS